MRNVRRSRATVAILLLTGIIAGCATAASSSPSPSAERSAGTSVAPTETPGPAACVEHVSHAPGTYRLTAADTETVPATVTLAQTGWSGCGLLTKEFGPPAGPALIGFWAVENVYTDPCHWDGALMDPAVGPTVADLAKALGEQALTEASDPADDTLGGVPATHVQLSVPADLDTTTCQEDQATQLGTEFRFWNGPGEAVWWLGAKDAPGLIGEVWAADVNGTRVVVQAAHFSDGAQAEVDEILEIVRSITFGP